ncbi:unnamed protein product [Tetraodon nigroviridis]|uniref:(spotted green pufferfish) hypothetical protein n=1 Tax=Tetraodon nigroviridis TaxID=99883 RepID=Q4TAI2_TETNG|nr:unnamed protein product [Tetraodon nigroviridis]
MRDSGFPFWFGGMLILIGASCILSERRPSPNRVTLNVTLNIVGFALAVAAIVLYINSVADTWLEWMCDHDYSTETPWQKLFAQKCWEKTQSTEGLLKCIYSLLIILSFMEVFVSISSVVLGIKAFGSSPGRENRSNEDAERCTPLLAEASGDPTP